MLNLQTAYSIINKCPEGFYPKGPVNYILDHQEEALPLLREVVRSKVKEGYAGNIDPAEIGFSFALHFLSVFKDSDVHSEILQFLRWEEEKIDNLIGDMLTENMGMILHKTSGGRYEGIQKLFKDSQAYEYSREAANRARIYGALVGKISKQQLIDETLGDLRLMLQSPKEAYNEVIFQGLLDVLEGFGVKEAVPLLKEFYPITEEPDDLAFVIESLSTESTETLLGHLEDEYKRKNPKDFYDRVRWWSLFGDYPLKVGRNDPCPCGSGVKYKKCCLV